jgi:uncharacterized protein
MKTILTATALILLSTSAYAQAFNCGRSRSATEVIICQDGELSRLDNRLNRIYSRANVSVREQRRWLASRNSCGVNRGCIRRHYVRRIEELRD